MIRIVFDAAIFTLRAMPLIVIASAMMMPRYAMMLALLL